MYLSSIVAGEFAVKQKLTDLPLQNFRTLAYEMPHAEKAARLFNLNRNYGPRAPGESRAIIINDLKIIAQAAEDQIRVILTKDSNTLAKIAGRLQQDGLLNVFTLLLSEGYKPGRLINPEQPDLFETPLPIDEIDGLSEDEET
jgi:hypothetical protein